MEELELKLIQGARYFYSTVFDMPGVGERVTISNPLTGGEHVLTVVGIEQKTVRQVQAEGLTFPYQGTVMEYRLEPDIPRDQFFLTDLAESDEPIRTGKGSIRGGAVGLPVSNRNDPEKRRALSSLHFETVETITWQAEFRAKTVEDFSVKLI